MNIYSLRLLLSRIEQPIVENDYLMASQRVILNSSSSTEFSCLNTPQVLENTLTNSEV